MSWLSNFLGIKKIKLPQVKPAEEMDYDPYQDIENEEKKQSRKKGFLAQIMTGNYLGAR